MTYGDWKRVRSRASTTRCWSGLRRLYATAPSAIRPYVRELETECEQLKADKFGGAPTLTETPEAWLRRQVNAPHFLAWCAWP